MGNEWPLGRTSRVHGRKLGIFLCAATLCVLLGAGNAHAAKNICVGVDLTNACPAGSTSATSPADAVTKATDPTRNNVYITSGNYSTSGLDFGSAPTKIFGVGATKPVLSMSGLALPGTAALTMSPLTTEVSNIEVDLPASTGLVGISAPWGGQSISNVSVVGTDADASRGIYLSLSTPKVKNATINLSGANTTGIYVDGSTTANLDDVDVQHATTAVDLESAQSFVIRRLRSKAKNGVVVNNLSGFDGTISSSLIEPSDDSADHNNSRGVVATAAGASTSTIRVDNCTIIGAGSGSTGLLASAAVAVIDSQTIAVNSSLITGFATTAATSGLGNANVSLAYTLFSPAAGAGVTTLTGSHLITGDLGFAGPTDYRPTLGSQLVDAGDPDAGSFNADDSPSDLDGNPRVVSRGAGNIRDIGAYEVQNTTPVPAIKILTSVPSTTVSTEFTAAGSSDAEGDSMTYNWSFDGAPAASGVTAKKLFAAEGPHTVQLTVADKTGASATISQQFNVARGFLPLTLRSQNARLTTKGTFTITMTCPAEAISNCSGRLVFKTAKKVDAKNYTERPGWAAKTEYLQAARYVFSIPPASTRKLEVRTYSTFQNVLWKHKKFAIVGSLVSGTTSNANLTANRATFTIRAPKSRR